MTTTIYPKVIRPPVQHQTGPAINRQTDRMAEQITGRHEQQIAERSGLINQSTRNVVRASHVSVLSAGQRIPVLSRRS